MVTSATAAASLEWSTRSNEVGFAGRAAITVDRRMTAARIAEVRPRTPTCRPPVAGAGDVSNAFNATRSPKRSTVWFASMRDQALPKLHTTTSVSTVWNNRAPWFSPSTPSGTSGTTDWTSACQPLVAGVPRTKSAGAVPRASGSGAR